MLVYPESACGRPGLILKGACFTIFRRGRPLSIPGARGTGCLISPPAKAVILFLLNYCNLSYLIIYLGANRCVPHTQIHLLKSCAIRPFSRKSTMTPSNHSVPGLQHTTPRSARYSNPFPNLHKIPQYT